MQNNGKIGIGLLTGIGLGSGLMFFLDPNRGKQRRALVRDQAKRTSRQLGRVAKSVDRTAHDLAKGADELTKRVFVWKRKAIGLVA
jgi:gas vesicle protein